MCTNCKDSEGCACTGGSLLATCSCERGYHCPVCRHQAVANMGVEANLLIEILSPDLNIGARGTRPPDARA